VTFADVAAFVKELAGVSVATKWGNKTWVVGDKGFAWQRPLRKSDLARYGDETPPSGEILAVRVENLDAKDALLAIAPPGFFTIPHFNGYAAVLIELRLARAKDVKAALLDAHRAIAAAPAKKRRTAATKAKPKPKAKAKPRKRTRGT
jgi:hypothetical protein